VTGGGAGKHAVTVLGMAGTATMQNLKVGGGAVVKRRLKKRQKWEKKGRSRQEEWTAIP